MELVAMDMVRNLPKTTDKNLFVFVISDGCSKLMKEILTAETRVTEIATVFLDHWTMLYWMPSNFLNCNGHQVLKRFCISLWFSVRTTKLTTNANHPKRNGQVKRHNGAILATFRSFSTESQIDWNLYTQVLTYAYNMQMNIAKVLSTVVELPLRDLQYTSKLERVIGILTDFSTYTLPRTWKKNLSLGISAMKVRKKQLATHKNELRKNTTELSSHNWRLS